MDINDYYWHDKILLNIFVDRKTPGIIDEVSFGIEDEGLLKKLTFSEVYHLKLHMNFGIVAEESINSIRCLPEDDEDLLWLYRKWKGSLHEKRLLSYAIELNSTGGMIKIIAGKFTYRNAD